jgi:hypothetical protein
MDTGPHTCSKKQRSAFQTITETPTTTPSMLGFGITHQPHEGGDGAKCGAKFADTPCTVSLKVTSANQMPKEIWLSRQENHVVWLNISETRATNSGVAFEGDPESNGG